MNERQSTRVREHPSVRFAGTQTVLDLPDSIESLLSEGPAGQHGHRQKALFHHGSTTLALFSFEQGSTLPDHVVDGVVIIQVLTGKLGVKISGQEHTLMPSQVLVLAPGVPHDVNAYEESHMLLTVCLGPVSSDPKR